MAACRLAVCFSTTWDASGNTQASYGYKPYGQADSALSQGDPDQLNPLNAFRFSARRVDTGSGTTDMGARRFGPDTSRFLTQDLFYGALANLALSIDPLTQNRYGLAGGNPIGFTEWDGHMTLVDGGGGASLAPQALQQRSCDCWWRDGGGSLDRMPTLRDDLRPVQAGTGGAVIVQLASEVQADEAAERAANRDIRRLNRIGKLEERRFQSDWGEAFPGDQYDVSYNKALRDLNDRPLRYGGSRQGTRGMSFPDAQAVDKVTGDLYIGEVKTGGPSTEQDMVEQLAREKLLAQAGRPTNVTEVGRYVPRPSPGQLAARTVARGFGPLGVISLALVAWQMMSDPRFSDPCYDALGRSTCVQA